LALMSTTSDDMPRAAVGQGILILLGHISRCFVVFAVLSLLSGCGVGHEMFGLGDGGGGDAGLGQAASAPAVFGYAVADEPQAALVGRQVLSAGGNAADAAAAMGFAMAVTLPSRAGLGGGGACVVKMPGADAVTLAFAPGAPAAAGGGRPAAVPGMARGLLALQAKYGALPYAATIVPAERLAGGVPVSTALAADLQVVGPALLADPAAASVFGSSSGAVLAAGATMTQPDLAATLEILRTQGVPGFYNGDFAAQFAQGADAAGANVSAADLQAFVPAFGAPNTYTSQGFDIAMLPVAAASATVLPASAGFAAVDKDGGAVACATTMNNLFGTGRVAAGTGILLAASPKSIPTPELAAGIASAGDRFRAAVTGTGEAGAGQAAVDAMEAALHKQPAAVAAPGRANVISCPGLVPGGEATCNATADPRGDGLAVGGR
jgi:gamma-glutamyltranspeptidase/glutathione hydrolase